MSELKTYYLTQQQYSDWDRFVEGSKGGTIFHKSYWLRASNRPFKILVCGARNEMRGGFALSEHKNALGQKVITNPPLTPYQGIVYEPRKGKRAQIYSNRKRISEMIVSELLRGYKNFDIRFSPGIIDLQPFIWRGFNSQIVYTYLLETEDLEVVWQNLESNCRNSIKKARKDNLQVTANLDFDTLMELVRMTLNRQNLKIWERTNIEGNRLAALAWPYFKAVKNRNQCKCFITYDSGKPIAGIFIVWDKKRAYYLLGGYDPNVGHRGAMSLAFWKAIEHTYYELGLKEFDFEGSIFPHIEHYFRSYGGKLTPVYSVSRSGIINTIYNGLLLLRGRLMYPS